MSKPNQSLENLTGIWVLTFRMVTKGHVGWKVACGNTEYTQAREQDMLVIRFPETW